MERKKLTVTKDFGELQLQAVEETRFYLKSAVQLLDEEFGEGYAKEHPEAISSVIQAMAIEAQGSSICASILQLEEELASSIDAIQIHY